MRYILSSLVEVLLVTGIFFGQESGQETLNEPQTNTHEKPLMGETNLHPSFSPPVERETYRHMIGAHYGTASGAGLCYKHYFSGPHALQISLVPFYLSGENTPGQGFVIGGIFGQWFLDNFSHPLTSLIAKFFLWGGIKGGVYFGGSFDYEIGGGGGIGLESYAIHNIVFTMSVGYFFQITSFSQCVNFPFPLGSEWTIGYRF
ncbi:MAG: hypothetical protein N2314_05055 [Brevinematales bacterium]|nr:hypothetical protein [Brevinematales bacterium]